MSHDVVSSQTPSFKTPQGGHMRLSQLFASIILSPGAFKEELRLVFALILPKANEEELH